MIIDASSGIRLRKTWTIALISCLAFLWLEAQIGSLGQTVATNETKLPTEYPEDSVKTLLKCGISKHRLGDDAEAEEYFKQALKIDHENADAFFNLGVIAEQKGDLELASRNYRAALRSDPTDKEFQAAELEVEKSIATRQSNVLSGQATSQIYQTNNVMPPRAPSFSVSLPTGRTQYQTNIARQSNAASQLPSEDAPANQPHGQGLMRTALGIARLLNHDSCSLCGGLLRRW
jgi:tetratricopeptide (TPR) repeat protein